MKLCLLALVTFILFLSTQIGVPSLPRLSAELGANPQEMAAVLSSALMTLVALQFFSGTLADPSTSPPGATTRAVVDEVPWSIARMFTAFGPARALTIERNGDRGYRCRRRPDGPPQRRPRRRCASPCGYSSQAWTPI